ncbi:putative enoyl-CoA hydratase 1 [Actinomadura rubteroloni]|uniref:Putative enoyl-CoA hydratase 1 n=1 Tax=Actinomadura rubteroloni TaxID=1926885 RepID=A0A2P4UNS6_9ACTN|nr:MaoC/PaaZ C-terminal domain-containing protein [Actinomadura rubteroloni]POM26697.1 putative enoyl-CoA hydratase 1 [Actinomadura rubteroloni]
MPYTPADVLSAVPGTPLFTSGWIRVGPEDEAAFCEATFLREEHLGRRPSPVGAAGERAVSGFLLLSMLAVFHKRELRMTSGHALNYGLDRVRFFRPVPTGARVRLHAELGAAEQKTSGRIRVTTRNTLEVDDAEPDAPSPGPRPAMTADWLMLLVLNP